MDAIAMEVKNGASPHFIDIKNQKILEKQIIQSILAACYLFAFNPAHAAMALAFSETAPPERNFSVATNEGSKAVAINKALQACTKITGKTDCKIILSSEKNGYGAIYGTCVTSNDCFYSFATGYSNRNAAHDAILAACKRDYGVNSCAPWGDWEDFAKSNTPVIPAVSNEAASRINALNERLRNAHTPEEKARAFEQHHEAGGAIWETAEAMGLSREQAEKIKTREKELTDEWNRQHQGEREIVAAELQRRGIAKSKEEANRLAKKREDAVRHRDIFQRLERE